MSAVQCACALTLLTILQSHVPHLMDMKYDITTQNDAEWWWPIQYQITAPYRVNFWVLFTNGLLNKWPRGWYRTQLYIYLLYKVPGWNPGRPDLSVWSFHILTVSVWVSSRCLDWLTVYLPVRCFVQNFRGLGLNVSTHILLQSPWSEHLPYFLFSW